jgi:acyl-CoA thioester hydrolase
MPQPEAAPQPVQGNAFQCTLPMRWGDMDALGHMNNAVYFRLFEEARIMLLARLGGFEDGSATNQPGRVSVLAHTSCDFLKPVIYPASLVVSQWLVRLGRTSLEVLLDMQRADEPGVVYARGRYVVVGADAVTGRPVPWSPGQIQAVNQLFSLPA